MTSTSHRSLIGIGLGVVLAFVYFSWQHPGTFHRYWLSVIILIIALIVLGVVKKTIQNKIGTSDTKIEKK